MHSYSLELTTPGRIEEDDLDDIEVTWQAGCFITSEQIEIARKPKFVEVDSPLGYVVTEPWSVYLERESLVNG